MSGYPTTDFATALYFKSPTATIPTLRRGKITTLEQSFAALSFAGMFQALHNDSEYTRMSTIRYGPDNVYTLDDVDLAELSPQFSAEEVYRAEISSDNVIGEDKVCHRVG